MIAQARGGTPSPLNADGRAYTELPTTLTRVTPYLQRQTHGRAKAAWNRHRRRRRTVHNQAGEATRPPGPPFHPHIAALRLYALSFEHLIAKICTWSTVEKGVGFNADAERQGEAAEQPA